MAAAIPGDSFVGEVVVGGLLNFLGIYNILITGRVLLSWVPQVWVDLCTAATGCPRTCAFFSFSFCSIDRAKRQLTQRRGVHNNLITGRSPLS